MKLHPDEKELLESFERGEWKPVEADEVDRMRALARRGGRSYDSSSGRRLAAIKSRGRATQTKRS